MSSSAIGDINIVIADDHEIFRDGFKLMLSRDADIHLIGEAANGQQLVEMVANLKPHVVITDIKMPIMDGIEATRILKRTYPKLGIIGLSMFDEEDLILEVLEAGAQGYLVKNADKEEVIAAIKSVYNEEPFYCKQTSTKLAQLIAKNKYNRHQPSPNVSFNEKELEVIKLICLEHTNKEIGDALFLSVRTVEGIRLKIQEKMKVKNSIGLVIYALQHDLFDPKNT